MARPKKLQPMSLEEFNSLSVSEKMNMAEKIGEEVQKELNKVVEKANKLLKPLGCALNPIKAEFGEIEQ